MTLIRLDEVSLVFPTSGRMGKLLNDVSESLGVGMQELLNPEFGRYYRDLRRGYELAGPGVALDRVNLVVRAGETMGIIGPSGCGKTSLLKVVAGIIQPTAGRVLFNNRDVTAEEPKTRRIGMVFQNYALYPHMESRENIAFFFRVHHRVQEIPERVRAVSQIMGVSFEHLLSRKPPRMSQGERQRVAIARCIAREPAVFLFDEPLSNLDAKLRVQTRVEIKRLLQRFHTTCLYVTHDQSEAIALADRIAVMRAGRIEQVGTFAELYHAPANSFVAEFVGTPPMNVWPARFEGETVEVANLHLPVPTRFRRPPARGEPVLFGIRPEHLELSQDGPLQMDVEVIEPLMPEHAWILRGRVGNYPAIARITDKNHPAVSRHSLHLAYDLTLVHLFDAWTGSRLR